MNRWNDKDRWIDVPVLRWFSGAGLVVSYADREGIKDTGYGLVLTFENVYTIGFTRYGSENGNLPVARSGESVPRQAQAAVRGGAYHDAMSNQDAVSLTKSLLRFDTINPPGRERDCARMAGALLQDWGFKVDYHEYADSRTSVVARAGGSERKAPLCLTGHLDVVPLGARPGARTRSAARPTATASTGAALPT